MTVKQLMAQLEKTNKARIRAFEKIGRIPGGFWENGEHQDIPKTTILCGMLWAKTRKHSWFPLNFGLN